MSAAWNPDLTQVRYEMCGQEGCWFFIEKNDAEAEPGFEIAAHVHLCAAEYDSADPDADHNATPSGDVRTLGEWRGAYPALFHEFPDGYIGPNSKYFVPSE
jgi:hypothetical protein